MSSDVATGARVRVEGGAGGTVARLEDVARAGQALEVVAGRVGGVAREGLALARSPVMLTTGVVSPVTAARAQAELLRVGLGPQGLVATAVRLGALAEGMRHALAVYRAWDEATAAVFASLTRTAGRAAGRALAPVMVTVVGTGLTTSVAVRLIGPRGEPGVPVGLRAAGLAVLALLMRDTRALEPVVAALPGVVTGLVPPGAGEVWGLASGERWPPDGVAGGAGVLAAAAGSAGVLGEPAAVTVTGVSRSPGTAPARIGDVLAGVRVDPRGPALVRVTGVVGTDGRRSWVVAVPGTRQWGPRGEETGEPFDLTGNVRGLAGQDTAARRAVVAAMREAGVGSGEPVLLAGYSQGGIVAASLAADPAVRREFTVTHVLTAGAPVGVFEVPDTVAVLALEHEEDPVPRLDGAANPAGRSWTTVSRRAADDPTGLTGPWPAQVPLAGHDLALYRRTADLAEDSGDPSVAAWRGSARAFFDRPGSAAGVTDVAVVRTPPAGSG